MKLSTVVNIKSTTIYSLKFTKKGYSKSFFFKVLNFLLANEFMRAAFFLNLRKFISKNKMVINLWAGVNLISWKCYCFWTFYKQNICDNRLTRKIRLSILHSFIVIYTNYSSHLVQMFKVQHFHLKWYNQNFTMHCAVYSTSYSTDQVLLTNKNDSRMRKKYPIPLESYNLHELVLTFQQKWCNYGEENLECLSNILWRRIWNVYPTFYGLPLSQLFRFS